MIRALPVERLYNGELICLGILDGGTDPEIIPANIFRPRAVEVDWDAARISGLGRLYMSVAICRNAKAPAM
jgi:hypothetical protein